MARTKQTRVHVVPPSHYILFSQYKWKAKKDEFQVAVCANVGFIGGRCEVAAGLVRPPLLNRLFQFPLL